MEMIFIFRHSTGISMKYCLTFLFRILLLFYIFICENSEDEDKVNIPLIEYLQ